MLLELVNLVQQLFGAFEDLIHCLVPVTVLETLAAAARTDVVAADSREVQRTLKRRAHLTRRARGRSLWRFRWLGDILRLHGIGCGACPCLAGLAGGIPLRSRRGGGLLLRHRRKSYPNSGFLKPGRPQPLSDRGISCISCRYRTSRDRCVPASPCLADPTAARSDWSWHCRQWEPASALGSPWPAVAVPAVAL